jgi:hypothetical protein
MKGVLKDDRYDHSLLEVCDGLHGWVCGSGDCPENFYELIDWLRSRRDNWHLRDCGRFSIYESAVWMLVTATLSEVDSFLKERGTEHGLR